MLFLKSKKKRLKAKLLYLCMVVLVVPMSPINLGAIASEALPNFIFQGYVEQANIGDANAQFSIGLLNEQGLAPESSISKAIDWYEKAAISGHVDAAIRAAELLLADKGDSVSKARAIVMLRIASKAGVLNATYTLAFMIQTGDGIAKNVNAALELYLEAAEDGHVDSMRQVGMLYWYGHAIEKDEIVAKNWLMRAASLGDEDSIILIEKINSAILE